MRAEGDRRTSSLGGTCEDKFDAGGDGLSVPIKSTLSPRISVIFALRRCITNPKRPRSAMMAMPPTTPPAILPVGRGLLEDVVLGGVGDPVLMDVGDGDDTVFVLIVRETDDKSGAPRETDDESGAPGETDDNMEAPASRIPC